MKPLLIAIAGGSASGKSSVAQLVYENFASNKKVYIFKLDDYYNDQSNMKFEDRLLVNYDHPYAFDNKLIHQHIMDLLARKSIAKPTYDFSQYTRSEKVETVNPSDVIIVEGLFALLDKELLSLFDLKVFVDTDADIRLIRRLKRDVNERSRTLESVIKQYEEVVKPMHEQFIEPSKKNADIIIPRGKENVKAIDLINTKIASIL